MAEVNATRDCVVCGAAFPRKGKTLSCSDACKHARYQAISKAGNIRAGRLKGPQQLQCKRCGVGFVGQATRVYCSKKCKDAERRETPAWAESVKRKRLKPRKAGARRKRGNRSEELKRYRKRHADKIREKDRARELVRNPGRKSRDARRVASAYRRLIDLALSLNASAAKAIGKRTIAEAKTAAAAGRGSSNYTIALKSNPVAYIAAIGRWRAKTLKRKTGKTMIDDGTASAVAVSLMATKSCLYCACELTDESRTIDHMDPLSKGGTHSASNLCACCSSCNNKKGARGFMQFVAGLSDNHRRRAIAYYERLNKFVQQGSLSFGMAA